MILFSSVAVQHIINFHDAQHQEAIRERQVCFKTSFKIEKEMELKNPLTVMGLCVSIVITTIVLNRFAVVHMLIGLLIEATLKISTGDF